MRLNGKSRLIDPGIVRRAKSISTRNGKVLFARESQICKY